MNNDYIFSIVEKFSKYSISGSKIRQL